MRSVPHRPRKERVLALGKDLLEKALAKSSVLYSKVLKGDLEQAAGRRYELERPIARGGMAVVYRGVCRGALGFRTRVAIKRLRTARAKDFDARMMLQQEAELCATLEHPNVVPVLDLDQNTAGDVWLIMMYSDGVDLEDLLASGMLPISIVTYIASSVLNGLAYIHKRGIIHRDITLGNILVSRAGAVRITDFGLAMSMEDSNLDSVLNGGTAGFMSPEAVRNEPLDARSDLFSLGAVLYHLLTGRAAFPGAKARKRMAQTLCQTPEPPHVMRPQVPQELSKIIMRLLAPDREDRFASALEVLDVLPAPSKYGSEDLAALLGERHKQGRLRLPSMRHEIRSEQAGEEGNGAEDRPIASTMLHPERILRYRPFPRMDPAVLAEALAEAEVSIVPKVRQDDEMELEEAETPSESVDAPTPPRAAIKRARAASRRMPQWLKAYLVVMAVAAIYVWGTLGWRALQPGQQDAQKTVPTHIEATELPDRVIDRDVPPGPSKAVEPAPSPRPIPIESGEDNKSIDLSARGQKKSGARSRERKARADAPTAPIARKATEEETTPMDTPQSQGWASSIDNPTAVNPFERFAGPIGEKVPGEVVMQP